MIQYDMKMNSAGASLRDLLTYIILIFILVIGAKPLYVYLKNQSDAAKAKSSLADVRSAVDIFYAHRGDYPRDLFADLTTNFEFMPAVGGVRSLGRYVIPPNDNNPGHNGPLYKNASDPSAVHYGEINDQTPLHYDLTITGEDKKLNPKTSINCIHATKSGHVWKNL